MSVAELLEFKEMIKVKEESEARKPDKQTRKLLLYLFTGTRGGFTRLRIIMLLLQRPYNTHQLAKELDIDYKAVQHHMQVLEKNNLITKEGEKYGITYFISTFLEVNMEAFDEIVEKLEKSK